MEIYEIAHRIYSLGRDKKQADCLAGGQGAGTDERS